MSQKSLPQLPNDWYTQFFTGAAVSFWQSLMTPEMTASDCAFLEKSLSLSAGATLLDVPCGHGRHALALVRQGYQVIGVDASEDCLVAFQQAIELEANLKPLPVYRLGEMGQLPHALDGLNALFDGAYCLGNSFGYLALEEMTCFLRDLARLLKPGARFVMDSGMMAESIFMNFEAKIEMETDGIRFLAENIDYDPITSALYTRFEFVENSQKTVKQLKHHVYTTAQLVGMMQAAGLTLVGLYADTDGTPFELASVRLLGVFEKAD